MNRITRVHGTPAKACCAMAVLGGLLLATGCDDDDDDDYYDPDAYAYGYDYYYPADFGYADAYYADDLYGLDDDLIVDAEFKQTTSGPLPGRVIRDLASGEDVCPGQVTVTPEGSAAACATGGPVPASTSIVFQGCQLAGGGKLDGSLRIDVTQTAKDTNCDDATVLDVQYTSTATNLSYTGPSGGRVVLPTLTLVSKYSRALGSTPKAIDTTVEGQLVRMDEGGAVALQLTVSGSQRLTPLDSDAGYRVDGTLTMTDTAGGTTSVASGDGVTRTDDCCYPTSGSIEVEHSDGSNDEWRFGSECGDVSLNGDDISLSECF